MNTISVHPLIRGLFLLGLLCSAQPAMSQAYLTLSGESRLWIKGSSSVNTFTCEAGSIQGFGLLDPVPSGRQAVAEVQVPVRQFDCGKPRMNEDFYKALKAEALPQILFDFTAAELTSQVADEGRYLVSVTGRLLIAGTERPARLRVQGQQRLDGSYRATGSLPLLMSDFGIDPPTALLGLIKAHDVIVVYFDLIAIPQTMHTTQ